MKVKSTSQLISIILLIIITLYLNLYLGISVFVIACVWFLVTNNSQNNKFEAENYMPTVNIEALLQVVLDNIQVAICLRDSDLNIIYFNSHYTQIALGEDKVIDNDSIEIDKHTKETAKLAQITKKDHASERYIVIKGQRYYYQFIDYYIPAVNQVCSIAYDITNKALVTKELELNINAQKKLIESSNNAVAIFDSDRRIKYYNQAYVKLWQFDEAYLESGPRYEEILDKLYQERKTSEHPNFSEFKQSRVRLFTTLTDTYNDFIYLPDSRLLRLIIIPYTLGGLLLSFEDMTDHFAMQRSYNTLIKVQYTTLNSLQESICVFGNDGAITLHNSKFRELWQLDIELLNSNPTIFELVESYKHLLVSEKDLSNHKNNVALSFHERKPVEEYIKRADNQYIRRHIVPLPDGATMISDLNVTDSALVEQSLLERTKALEDADHIKSEFLANVSYELRSPLMSIIGYSELLKGKYEKKLDKGTKIGYINNILDSSEKLSGLIDDIIDLAVVEFEKIELNKEIIDVINVIQDSIGLVRKLAQNINVECILSYKKNIKYTLYADERRFKQVITKLLSNAIEYSSTGAKVFIDVKIEKTYMRISVSNYGNEIPLEEQEFIFHKFYQARNTKTTGKSGVGIGLSIVKEIVGLHNGTIKFSSNQDLGTTFICRFPLINSSKKGGKSV